MIIFQIIVITHQPTATPVCSYILTMLNNVETFVANRDGQ